MIPLNAVLAVSAVLFAIGAVGVLTRRNILIVLMGLELMLNAANLSFVAFSRLSARPGMTGQIFPVFIIAVAAGEVAIGLAIVIALYRNRDTVNLDDVNILKG